MLEPKTNARFSSQNYSDWGKKTSRENLQKGQLWDYCFFWITGGWEVSAKKESMIIMAWERPATGRRLIHGCRQACPVPMWCCRFFCQIGHLLFVGILTGIGDDRIRTELFILLFWLIFNIIFTVLIVLVVWHLKQARLSNAEMSPSVDGNTPVAGIRCSRPYTGMVVVTHPPAVPDHVHFVFICFWVCWRLYGWYCGRRWLWNWSPLVDIRHLVR